jgi:hypothetical protein
MTQNPAQSGPHADAVIHGGPLFHWLTKLGVGFAGGRTKFLCLLYAVATWGVMAVLAIAQGVFVNSSLTIPFLFDISEACRWLIVGPLLIAAEPIIEPWLKNVVHQFRELTPSDEHAMFDKHVADTRKLRDLWYVEALIILFALVRPHFDASIAFMNEVPSWQLVANQASYAELYCNFVAKPLMGCLWLRWLWKYVVWSLLLCRIAALQLRLVPTHPDDMAGLGFVGVGQAKFSILVMALSVLVAAGDANRIIFTHASFLSIRWIIVAVLVLALVIFMTPLLAFTPKLIECKRRGLFEYGRLAQEYVNAFDEKWIERRHECKEELLGHNDVSVLGDLENAYNIVQRMKIFLIDRSLLTTFTLSCLLPFAPLALTLISFEDLLDRVFKNFV